MWYVAIATIDYQTNKYGVIQLEFILFLYVGCKFLFLVLSLAVTTWYAQRKANITEERQQANYLAGRACRLQALLLYTMNKSFFGMMSLLWDDEPCPSHGPSMGTSNDNKVYSRHNPITRKPLVVSFTKDLWKRGMYYRPSSTKAKCAALQRH